MLTAFMSGNLKGIPVIRRLLREPLLHFLLIGAALFLLFGVSNGGSSGAPRKILISEARTKALAENFAAVWMRPPTTAELKGLIDDYIAEEVYYREAVAMGLDQDDTVIRRRLRQKMEFISESVADSVEPADAQLQEYLAQNAGKFVRPAELTFRQVYLSAERRGDAVRADAEKLLAELQVDRGTADRAEVGDSTLLPALMEAASPQAIANAFGQEFAQQIDEAPVGQWSGPLESAYGLHLVRVDARTVGKAPTLDEIRPVVLREWQAAQRQRQGQSFLAALRDKYEVRVEGPAAELFAAPSGGGAAQ
jgi:parvulin-like peptidyl-prolyl isomerase